MAAKRWVLAAASLLACRNEAAVVVSHVVGKGGSVVVASSIAGSSNDLLVDEHEHNRHRQALDDLMQNMTISRAMGLLSTRSKATVTLLAFVRQALGVVGNRSNLRLGAGQKPPAAAPDPAGDTAKATEEINEMIYEVQTKYELEHMKCCEYERTKRFMLEETAQDIALFNAEAAQGRGGVLAATTQLTIANNRVPKLKEALDQNSKRCQGAQDVITQQLTTVLNDIDTLGKVLGITSCGNGTAPPAAAKMMLISSAAEMVHSSETKAAIMQTLHEEQKLALQRSKPRGLLAHVAAHRHHQVQPKDPATTPAPKGSPNKPGEAPANVDPVAAAAGKALDPFKLAPAAARGGGPCSRPSEDTLNKFKCAVPADASCQRIQERFLTLQMATIDKRDSLRKEQQELITDCAATTEDIRNQLSAFQSLVMDQQTLLARWTKSQNDADEQSRLKNVEREAMDKEFQEMTKTCHDNYAGFEAQECGLRKIRGELSKLNNSKLAPYFQDCDVSAWSPEACSVTCGGGTQRLSRSIITAPQNGVKCLPLSRIESCNTKSCPLDCKLSDWQSWSACTAKCGGGVMQRARNTLVKARFGGQVCSDTSESRSCNLQSCDQDCTLNDWSQWSSCSKQCNSGRQRRLRSIKDPATGTGKCPGERVASRLEYQLCNKDACPQDLQCKSANLDVVVVVDGATSQGEAGWNATRAAASALVQGLAGPGGAQVALLTFSGPESWADVSKCTGEAFGAVDIVKVCKLAWVSHFVTNGTSLGENVSKLAWPKGTRLTSSALGLAEAELSIARKEANSVVVVLTSGSPLSDLKTKTMSLQLRKRARLMYVAITDSAPASAIRQWSSEPDEENVLVVATFDEFQRRQTVDAIISDICPQVAPRAEYSMVGSFGVHSGPVWSSNPVPVSCAEACVTKFGAGTYRCSTQPGTLNYQAFLTGWGDNQYCTKSASDTWKAGSTYNCGSKGCSYSAMTVDHCASNPQNYCWRFTR